MVTLYISVRHQTSLLTHKYMALVLENSYVNHGGSGNPTKSNVTPSGDNRLLIVVVSVPGDNNTTVGSATFGGVSMTNVGYRFDADAGCWVSVYKLVNPSTTTGNVVVTMDKSYYYGIGVFCFSGASDVGNSSFVGAASTSVTVQNDGSYLIDVYTDYTSNTITVGTGQTQILNTSIYGYYKSCVSHKATDAGSISMSWSGGYAPNAAYGVVEIIPFISTTEVKTINGLAKASVKTINGLAIGSVKTWNGLA